MSPTGASFSHPVEGERLLVFFFFAGGDVGQSAAAGGNAGYLKLTPTVLLQDFSSALFICSHFFCLTLPQRSKAHIDNYLILEMCDNLKGLAASLPATLAFCTISLHHQWKRLRNKDASCSMSHFHKDLAV